MAAFPTVRHSTKSVRTVHAGIMVDRAEDGVPRTRSLYAADSYDFQVVLICSATDRDSIIAHQASEGASAFSYTWPDDGVAYTVRYAGPVEYRSFGAAGLWHVSVTLAGVAT